MHAYPPHLLKLIQALKKFPGVGNRTAERFAFAMLDWDASERQEMIEIIKGVESDLLYCTDCGCLIGSHNCPFCTEERADSGFLCVISSPKDVFAIESTNEFHGLYHVLGSLLSPLDGIDTSQLNSEKLIQRVREKNVREVLIAVDATLEGDATALFLKQQLESLNIRTSRLAFGLPMGTSLDYVDEGTLAKALLARSEM